MLSIRFLTLLLAAGAVVWSVSAVPTVYQVSASGLEPVSEGVLSGNNYAPEAVTEIRRRLAKLDTAEGCPTHALAITIPIRQRLTELAIKAAQGDDADEIDDAEETATTNVPPDSASATAKAEEPADDDAADGGKESADRKMDEPADEDDDAEAEKESVAGGKESAAAGPEADAAEDDEPLLTPEERQAIALELKGLEEASRRLVSCSPTHTFGWLTLFWTSLIGTEGKQPNFEALRMSYRTGPREAWVARRRSILVMPLYDQLPPDLQERAVAELVGLLMNHYAQVGLEILASTTAAGRARTLEIITALPRDVKDRLNEELDSLG